MAHTGGPRPIVPRGRIWKKQRAGVILRDGRTCQYCGKYPLGSKKDLTLGLVIAIAHCDHIKPREKGGPDELWNFVLACEQCNKTKGKKFALGLIIGQRNVVEFFEARQAAFLAGQTLPAFHGGLAVTPGQVLTRGQAPRVRNQPIDEETVERMWHAFQERASANYVAERCGVHHLTARRYVDFGDFRRGVEPFAVRLARIKTEAHRRADEQLIQTTAELLVDVSEVFGLMLKKLVVRDPATGRGVDLTVQPDFRDVVEMGRFRNLLAGGVDSRKGIEHRFSTMSEQELEATVRDLRARTIEGQVVDRRPPLPAASEPEPEPEP